jgi:dTDP-4-dehydrorhamnose 3,5-epimerase-like enzyme
MNKPDQKLWEGLAPETRALLHTREYAARDLADRLREPGVEVGELFSASRDEAFLKRAWIPGVEIFERTIHTQPHRGVFGEFARRDEGMLKQIGLWPAQWATARMFVGTAKGFHIHPPRVPKGRAAAEWFRELFADGAQDYAARPYDQEQWDVIFFVQGRVEFILRDARAGMNPRIMRFFIDGDNRRSGHNAGVVVPAGVAHAMRVEGNEDAIMVYGTTTSFHPEFEGRIASEIETASLPASWTAFLRS